MRPFVRVLLAAPLVLAPVVLFATRGAVTVPLYAAREKMQCQLCHVDPNGGGIRNDFGFGYARNRHSLVPETGKPWGELNLTNHVGESMPLYFGLDLRHMFILTTSVKSDSLDRAALFPMEHALHVSFQPHPLLATQLTWDFNEFSGATLREGYGMLRGGPWGGYAKFGRFRPPFGLRMDDHTVATRNGFLDFSFGGFPSPRFLPYDPRGVDNGLEVGGAQGPFFGRAAWTNGSANAFSGNTYAQAKTVKLGYQSGLYQGAVSLYDDFNSPGGGAPYRRATRWGYYGMVRVGPVTGLGEVAAGTDKAPGGAKNNLLAGFGEADWRPVHAINLRLRYDYLETDRDDRDSRHQRYAVETEWLPVPFAELRLVYRAIDHKDKTIEDENQVYLQGHFTY